MTPQSIIVLTALATEESAIRRALSHHTNILVHRIGLSASLLSRITIKPDMTVLLAGVAGGCNMERACGNVVIDPWPDGFASSAAQPGKIICSDVIVCSAQDKQNLYTQHGAQVVEMESKYVKAEADRVGARFIHIRSVLDTANDILPPQTGRWLASDGRLRPGGIAGTVLRHPSQIGALMALGRQTKHSLATLSIVVRELVDWLVQQ